MSLCLLISGYSFIFLILFISLSGIECGSRNSEDKPTNSTKLHEAHGINDSNNKKPLDTSNNNNYPNKTSNSSSYQSDNRLNNFDNKTDNVEKKLYKPYSRDLIINLTEEDIIQISNRVRCSKKDVVKIIEKLSTMRDHQSISEKKIKKLSESIGVSESDFCEVWYSFKEQNDKQDEIRKSKRKPSLGKKITKSVSNAAKFGIANLI